MISDRFLWEQNGSDIFRMNLGLGDEGDIILTSFGTYIPKQSVTSRKQLDSLCRQQATNVQFHHNFPRSALHYMSNLFSNTLPRFG